ncbi:hypothetical protein [Streptomyces sp. Sce081]|uniref:hypothetical protein n=1 Tax=Streptomyces sp. Sce081 TaxID=3349853 RepID=UPI0035F3D0EC
MSGALPTGPVLTDGRLGALPRAAGRYLDEVLFRPVRWAERWRYEELDITTAIYLISDTEHRLRWLGQANRADGLLGRLDRHDNNPAKRRAFARIRVLQLTDHTPPEAVDAIEGRCADLLRIRDVMRPRRWPPADDWFALTS